MTFEPEIFSQVPNNDFSDNIPFNRTVANIDKELLVTL
jgi:hypothetical protein